MSYSQNYPIVSNSSLGNSTQQGAWEIVELNFLSHKSIEDNDIQSEVLNLQSFDVSFILFIFICYCIFFL